MKKILASIFIGVLSLTLAGCTTEQAPNYTLTDTVTGSAIDKAWFSSVKFKSDPVVAREDKTVTTYEVFLPEDIAGASRYTLTNIEDIVYNSSSDESLNAKFRSINYTYLSCDSVDFTSIISQVSEVSDLVNSAYQDIEASVPLGLTNPIPVDELENVSYHEGEVRALLTIFLPVEVKGYTARDGQIAVYTLHTFVLVPVYYEITYATLTDDDKLELLDANPLKDKYEIIRLKTSASQIIDLAE